MNYILCDLKYPLSYSAQDHPRGALHRICLTLCTNCHIAYSTGRRRANKLDTGSFFYHSSESFTRLERADLNVDSIWHVGFGLVIKKCEIKWGGGDTLAGIVWCISWNELAGKHKYGVTQSLKSLKDTKQITQYYRLCLSCCEVSRSSILLSNSPKCVWSSVELDLFRRAHLH